MGIFLVQIVSKSQSISKGIDILQNNDQPNLYPIIFISQMVTVKFGKFHEFFSRLSADKKAGVFDCVVEALIQKISTMIGNSEIVISTAKEDFLLSANRFSVAARNDKLLRIYSGMLKS